MQRMQMEKYIYKKNRNDDFDTVDGQRCFRDAAAICKTLYMLHVFFNSGKKHAFELKTLHTTNTEATVKQLLMTS